MKNYIIFASVINDDETLTITKTKMKKTVVIIACVLLAALGARAQENGLTHSVDV